MCVEPLRGPAPLVDKIRRRGMGKNSPIKPRKDVQPLNVMFAQNPEKSGWLKTITIAAVVAGAVVILMALFI